MLHWMYKLSNPDVNFIPRCGWMWHHNIYILSVHAHQLFDLGIYSCGYIFYKTGTICVLHKYILCTDVTPTREEG